ncbi:MAG: 50S ribosomal protein L11 methyltransferase [Defluviitaleaceae bacterium]|nr:50S ribosomal protein L11 methyltransferase [Defluviitaleaceae bacterium]
MEWIEARIQTNGQGSDLAAATLMDCGIEGTEIVDTAEMRKFLETNPLNWDYVDDSLMSAEDAGVVVKFYVRDNDTGRETLGMVRDALRQLGADNPAGSLGELCLTFSDKLDDDVWLSGWRKHYKPFRLGRSVVIVPTWERYDALPGDVVFNIEPGHVFGTGLHQSTRLVVEMLEETAPGARRMLDIGCGSGILSVIGMLLGVREAAAVDIDPTAAQIAHENAALNGIDPARYRVFAGNVLDGTSTEGHDLSEIQNVSYDLVTANIVADVVIALAPYVARVLGAGGVFVSSGIISERLGDVTAALDEHGFTIGEIKEEDGWVAIKAGFRRGAAV